MGRKRRRRRRKQIGRGKGKGLAKTLIKNIGLPLLYKSGRTSFNLPTGIRLNVKKNGNQYGLHAQKNIGHLPFLKFRKKIL